MLGEERDKGSTFKRQIPMLRGPLVAIGHCGKERKRSKSNLEKLPFLPTRRVRTPYLKRKFKESLRTKEAGKGAALSECMGEKEVNPIFNLVLRSLQFLIGNRE